MNREQGGVLPMMLALLAAMAVAATVTARHGLHDHRLARRSYLRGTGCTIIGWRAGATCARWPTTWPRPPSWPVAWGRRSPTPR